jgi:3-phenylpropionate/trans-cinnamate dioxygenase ferredoxin subunit
MAYVTVAKTSEIAEGQTKGVRVQGKPLVICHVEKSGFYVVDDVCTHDDGPLSKGELEGTAIECPRHGARFDVTSGKVLCLPAAIAITSYPVKVENDEIQVDIG